MEMNVKKVLYFDVDGTIVSNEDKLLVEEKVFRRLMQDGVLTAVATGRTPLHIMRLVNKIGFNFYNIIADGQVLFYQGKYIVNKMFGKTDYIHIAKLLKEEYYIICEYENGYFYFDKMASRIFGHVFGSEKNYIVGDVEKYTGLFNVPFRIFVASKQYQKSEIIKKKIDLKLTGFADVFCYGDLWLELRPQNLNKRDAFLLAKKLSKQKEKYEYSYFADGKNDILMMQEVDCGFAVGDAAEELICLRKCQYIENISLYLKLVQEDLEN